jgi:glycosyltransferase involved in cell wall biosynthesis
MSGKIWQIRTMPRERPLLSVCIPAYNRPDELEALLESLRDEELDSQEIVVAEDRSPRGDEIQAVVERFSASNPRRAVRFSRNSRNLGYDANFRNLIELATGDYCLFMGDDDLVVPGAIAKVLLVLGERPGLGVILRSWKSIDRDSGATIMEHRYFLSDRHFPAGRESAITLFRRSVFLSGLVLHRGRSLAYATNRFDGTLLYQLHLVGNLMLDLDGYVISSFISLRRTGDEPTHFFGSAKTELGRYVPRETRREHSVTFMRGMLEIARALERSRGVAVYRAIVRDVGNYSYPVLSIQANGRRNLFRYVVDVGRLGLFRSPYFTLYAAGLLVLGRHRMDRVIVALKSRLGRTPRLGEFYEGESAG